MNMETKKHNVVVADERWDYCEHLQIGMKAKLVFCEDDSFGPVARMAYCEECAEAAQKEADEVLEHCHDCGNEAPAKEMCNWMGYDWSVSQGDEPLQICGECQEKEKHLKRCAKNKADYEAEFPDDNDYDDYPDDDEDHLRSLEEDSRDEWEN